MLEHCYYSHSSIFCNLCFFSCIFFIPISIRDLQTVLLIDIVSNSSTNSLRARRSRTRELQDVPLSYKYIISEQFIHLFFIWSISYFPLLLFSNMIFVPILRTISLFLFWVLNLCYRRVFTTYSISCSAILLRRSVP